MANFTAGTSFSDGVTNDVTAAKLNALVADAVPTSNLSLTSTTGTIATFNSTTGTIATLNSTTGTIATLNSTTGTIATLNSTTGTIATLNSTTGTIPTLVATTLVTTGTGTAAAPAIVPTGDTNTGIFFPAADTIAFSEGGAEAMRIDSSGNVGIGTASPGARLSVDSSTDGLYATFNSTSTNGGYLEFQSIGTVQGDIGTAKQIVSGSASDFAVNARGARNLVLGTNNTERIRITSGGYSKASDTGTYANSGASFHELRNSASQPILLASNSNVTPQGVAIRFTSAPNNTASQFFSCDDGDGATNRAIIRSNGGLLNYQANDGNLSDERLKTDIQPSPSYLDKICSIPVVNFKYKDQTHNDYNLGVIAQQVESICPEFVDADGVGETPEDGIPIKAIYQTDLQYALMKCIQELKSQNDSLRSRIEALEAK